MSIPPSVTIIKLGGSLMDLHDLRSRLLRLISSNTENNESIGWVLIIPVAARGATNSQAGLSGVADSGTISSSRDRCDVVERRCAGENVWSSV